MLFSAVVRRARERRLSPRQSAKRPVHGWLAGFSIALLTALLLAACGEEATPVPPTPTPTPRYQQENNTELQFIMNVPFGWVKGKVDDFTVVYSNPSNGNLGIGVVSRQIGKLTPDSQRLLQERTDQLKATFPGLREDVAGGGTLQLVDTTIQINRLSYTNKANVNVIQYIAEANNVKAQRAYILFAVTTAADANTWQPLYLDCFKSFTSTALPVFEQAGSSGVADPTVTTANEGGRIKPVAGRETKGRVLRLVEWESPVLNVTTKTPKITGLFPYEYIWRLRPFPSPDRPALYIESPIVDRTSSQASMQFGVYKDALPVTPSPDDWKKFYQPILDTLVTQNLKSYANNVTVGDITNVGLVYRVPWTARDDLGVVQSRGFILFSKSGTHGIVSLVSLSPAASVKQELVDSFDVDFQTIVSSFAVKF